MAASYMGAYWGIGVDVDPDALALARANFGMHGISNVDLIHSDIQTLSLHPGNSLSTYINNQFFE